MIESNIDQLIIIADIARCLVYDDNNHALINATNVEEIFTIMGGQK